MAADPSARASRILPARARRAADLRERARCASDHRGGSVHGPAGGELGHRPMPRPTSRWRWTRPTGDSWSSTASPRCLLRSTRVPGRRWRVCRPAATPTMCFSIPGAIGSTSAAARAFSTSSSSAATPHEELARVPTAPGARTSLFVPERDRLYLAVRASGSEDAAVWSSDPHHSHDCSVQARRPAFVCSAPAAGAIRIAITDEAG